MIKKRFLVVLSLLLVLLVSLPLSAGQDKVKVSLDVYRVTNSASIPIDLSSNYEFELRVDGLLYEGAIELDNGEVIQVTDGLVNLTQPGYFYVLDALLGQTIQVELLPEILDVYSVDETRFEFQPKKPNKSSATVGSGEEIIHSIRPRLIDIKDFVLNLVWNGGPTEKPDTNIELVREFNSGEQVVLFGESLFPSGVTTSHEYVRIRHTNNDGDIMKHYARQLEIHDDYRVVHDGFTVYNIYQIPITVTKKWVGGPVEKEPIEIQLLRNGLPYLDPVTLEDGESSYTWPAVDQNDENFQPYEYSVIELTSLEDYESTVDGFVITNTFTGVIQPDPEIPMVPLVPSIPKEENVPLVPLVPSTPKEPNVPADPIKPDIPNEPVKDLPKEKLPNQESAKPTELPPTGIGSKVPLGIILTGLGVVLIKRKES